MPKPMRQVNGSGMHLHLSLWRDGSNVFDDPAGELGLSKTAHHYIGGILKHARAIAALANPLVNSYKRLLPNQLYPVLVAWSERNRSTMIRVPVQRGDDARLILRSPDPTCNPYLALAATLEAGLHGITAEIYPPPLLLENNPGPDGCGEIAKEDWLPRSLGDALQALAGDEIIQKALGEHIFHRFLEGKGNEWERFQSEVHPWEIEQYLANY
jgi:glutamine synthetase